MPNYTKRGYYKPDRDDDLEVDVSLSDNFDKLDGELEDITTQLAEKAKQSDLDDREINMKSVGCVSDGVTDNTSIIQSQIDTLSSNGGGVLFFPKGTYMFTSIRLKSNIRIKGAGAEATTIKSNGTTTAVYIEGDVSPLRRVEFESIMILTPNLAVDTPAIYVNKAYYFGFTNSRVYGNSNRQGIGIRVIGTNTGYYGTYISTQFANFDIGAKFEGSANAQRFYGGWFYSCNVGMEINDSNGITLFGVTLQDFYKKAITIVDSGTGISNRNLISGCYIEAKSDSTVLECGIEIAATAKTTHLVGNLYNYLRSKSKPEVIDNSKSTTRLEWGSTSYNETLKLPTFMNLPKFDEATKPLAITEARGALAITTADATKDKLKGVLHDSAGVPQWVEIPYSTNDILNLSGITIQNGIIQQFSDGYIRVGTSSTASERNLNYDTGYKMLRYRDDTSWRYLSGIRSGSTASRPTTPLIGMEYFDTTLGKPVWCKSTSPSVWVDSAGTTV